MDQAIDDMGNSNDTCSRTCTSASTTDDGAQVNLDSRHDVAALCLALNCRPIDVYGRRGRGRPGARRARVDCAIIGRRGDTAHERRAVRGTAALPPIWT